ncbi:methyltransferase [Alteromonas lipolytica]|uniref:tRNA 5-carboxymethoxyuridine methyltransferase n=1 Tax=Alteromonas lipolytica TaxID=1856405 RepID=A0A1E8FHL3_9ALTE|nr:methyltransferase [Alteromonas lipolytica]OFI35098.1 SAM-dependent methyltransferase [Alteromonas lipolytica]GGF56630.1 tRNA 5-carboxymethoxyuridine methyltransferase [Alteromonas lipolytica]
MALKDQSFNGLAHKFNRNIYGTTKGQLRHTLLCEVLSESLSGLPPQRIIELGGGTGVMSAFLAAQGHHLTLTDISEEILALAREQLDSAIDIRQADLFSVNELGDFDVVVCHAVLEWLAHPFDALAHLGTQMAPGAKLSLTFFNRDAALFSNAIYGNFDYIARGMKVKNQVRLNPQQPLSPKVVIDRLEQLGFSIKSMRGIRCFHDYLRDKDMAASHYEELLALERQYCTQEPYLWLGKYFHLWLEKN